MIGQVQMFSVVFIFQFTVLSTIHHLIAIREVRNISILCFNFQIVVQYRLTVFTHKFTIC